jgi:hypothetical protein
LDYVTRLSDATTFSVTSDICNGVLHILRLGPCHIEVTFTPHDARAYHERLFIDTNG